MDNFLIFRENLRCFRRWKNMTGKEFSAFVGFQNLARVSGLEAERGRPSVEEIIQIARVMKCTTDELLFCVATIQLDFVDPAT